MVVRGRTANSAGLSPRESYRASLRAKWIRQKAAEETGIDARQFALVDWHLSNRFEIYQRWRSRYPPGTTHNTEHVYSLCVDEALPVILSDEEHVDFVWLPWQEAAEKVFSWTNRAAIRMLPARLGQT